MTPQSVPWETVIGGLAFAEAPRWHDGALYLSDIFGRAVWRVGADGAGAIVLEVPGRPSGLGWLPDGRMLVVSMRDRRVLVADGTGGDGAGGASTWADLSAVTPADCNDMAVDGLGRAYVGNFGYDLIGGAEPRATGLVLVDVDRRARVVADDILSPNGTVITPDGGTLIIGETRAHRLTAFRVADDGSLHDRRVFAEVGEAGPDGIALDAEGAVWMASPSTGDVLRVVDDGAGGRVTHRYAGPLGTAHACALGGPDGRTLFVCATPTHDEAEGLATRPGIVAAVTVDVPAAGPARQRLGSAEQEGGAEGG